MSFNVNTFVPKTEADSPDHGASADTTLGFQSRAVEAQPVDVPGTDSSVLRGTSAKGHTSQPTTSPDSNSKEGDLGETDDYCDDAYLSCAASSVQPTQWELATPSLLVDPQIDTSLSERIAQLGLATEDELAEESDGSTGLMPQPTESSSKDCLVDCCLKRAHEIVSQTKVVEFSDNLDRPALQELFRSNGCPEDLKVDICEEGGMFATHFKIEGEGANEHPILFLFLSTIAREKIRLEKEQDENSFVEAAESDSDYEVSESENGSGDDNEMKTDDGKEQE